MSANTPQMTSIITRLFPVFLHRLYRLNFLLRKSLRFGVDRVGDRAVLFINRGRAKC